MVSEQAPERERLIASWLEGSLSEEEARRLQDLCREDPSLLPELLALWEQDNLVAHLMAESPEAESEFLRELSVRLAAASDTEQFLGRLERRIRSHGRRRLRRPGSLPKARRTMLRYAALSLGAAAAFVALVLYVGGTTTRRTTDEATARLTRPRGEAQRTRDWSEDEGAGRVELSRGDSGRGATAEGETTARTGPPGDRTPAERDEEPRTDEGPAVAEVLPPAPQEAASPESRQVEPDRTHGAYLDFVEGDVEVARAGTSRWASVKAGVAFGAGDGLRTKLSRARIAYESGSVLYVNRFTTLARGTKAEPRGLSMVGGEVYVETVSEDRGFWVETPHGRAVDLGTKFGVDSELRGTTVTVIDGRVEAATAKGTVALDAGHEVLLARRTGPPGPVREARGLERRLGWVAGLKGSKEEVLFTEDFQAGLPGTPPAGWQNVPDRGEYVVARHGDDRFLRQQDAVHVNTEVELTLASARAWSGYTVRFEFRPVAVASSAKHGGQVLVFGHRLGLRRNYRFAVTTTGRLSFEKRVPAATGAAGRYQTLYMPDGRWFACEPLVLGRWYSAEFHLEPRADGVLLLGRVWSGRRRPRWMARHLDRGVQGEAYREGTIGFNTCSCAVDIDNIVVTGNPEGVGHD